MLKKIKSIPRSNRLMIFVERLETQYKSDVTDLAALNLGEGVPTGASPSEEGTKRGFVIYITGRTPRPKASADPLLRNLFRQWKRLGDSEKRFSVLGAPLGWRAPSLS